MNINNFDCKSRLIILQLMVDTQNNFFRYCKSFLCLNYHQNYLKIHEKSSSLPLFCKHTAEKERQLLKNKNQGIFSYSSLVANQEKTSVAVQQCETQLFAADDTQLYNRFDLWRTCWSSQCYSGSTQLITTLDPKNLLHKFTFHT